MVDLDAPSASASAAGFVSGLNIFSRLLAGNVRDRLRKVVVISVSVLRIVLKTTAQTGAFGCCSRATRLWGFRPRKRCMAGISNPALPRLQGRELMCRRGAHGISVFLRFRVPLTVRVLVRSFSFPVGGDHMSGFPHR